MNNLARISSLDEDPCCFSALFPPATISDMLGHLPPRKVMDRIIARFFQGKEPAWTMFHINSVLCELRQILAGSGACDIHLAGPALCDHLPHRLVLHEGRRGGAGKSWRCRARLRNLSIESRSTRLALDDYTKPGQRKVETMLLSISGPSTSDRQTPSWVPRFLLSVICRLAMHMGLHRDPRHYPEMSPFEGEMRRRVWTVLVGVDLLVSFQLWAAKQHPSALYDTERPSNLTDEDFDEDTKCPPLVARDGANTRRVYDRQDRLISIFGEIMAALASRAALRYAEIMQLDKKLKGVHDGLPAHLRHKPFNQSLADPVELIMQRYWLELLYQKSRSILHRKYLGISRMSPRYLHSRLALPRCCYEDATPPVRHPLRDAARRPPSQGEVVSEQRQHPRLPAGGHAPMPGAVLSVCSGKQSRLLGARD